MKHVIVGDSAAGVNAALAIRKTNPEDEIVIVERGRYLYYGRVLISYFIDGRVPYTGLFLADDLFYQKKRLKLMLDRAVCEIDSENRTLPLSNGEMLDYDRLLIASGASPKKLNVEGERLGGVFYLRTMDDAAAIKIWARRSKKVVIVGGGLVSLKSFESLRAMGIKATFVISSERVLSQMLDVDSSALVENFLRGMGADFRFGSSVERIEGKRRVERAVLSTGEKLDADMVIVGKGVVPNTFGGLRTNRGIIVDRGMKTSEDGIFAAGDAAEGYDILSGENRVNALWPIACEEGVVAGCNMAGEDRIYTGALPMNSLPLMGMNISSIGEISGRDVMVLKNPYRRFVFDGNRLTGAVIFGNAPFGVLRKLIIKGTGITDRGILKKSPFNIGAKTTLML